MQSTNGHTSKARVEAQKIAVQTKYSLEHAGSAVRRQLEEPTTGAALAGAAVVGATMFFGLPAALVGAVTGLVVHHILKSQQSPAPAR